MKNSPQKQQSKSRSSEAAIDYPDEARIDREYKEICRVGKEIETLTKNETGRPS
jgi:hypothetical protein